jgi:hypothetical protein
VGIQKRLDEDLKTALRARQQDRLSALRLIRAELKKESIDRGTDLDAAAEQEVLRRLAKQRRESALLFRQAGRADLADKEEAELRLIEGYLPEALSEQEIDAVIDGVLAELVPLDPKKSGAAIGKVMAALKATGKSYDAAAASQRVRSRVTAGS